MKLSFNGRPPVKKVISKTPRIPHPLRRSPEIQSLAEIYELRRLLRRNALINPKPQKDGFSLSKAK